MLPILLATLAFGVIHSLLAGHTARTAFRHWFGERAYHGLYRLVYNFLALITAAPFALMLLLLPGSEIWRVEGVAIIPLLLIQAAGIIGFLFALLQIDMARFLGLSQLSALRRGAPLPLPPEPLQMSGVYRLVRHPLYLFSLLVMWPMPIMTDTLLVFNTAATAYLLIGSRLEERRMQATFGVQYDEYRQRVPWMLPFPRPGR